MGDIGESSEDRLIGSIGKCQRSLQLWVNGLHRWDRKRAQQNTTQNQTLLIKWRIISIDESYAKSKSCELSADARGLPPVTEYRNNRFLWQILICAHIVVMLCCDAVLWCCALMWCGVMGSDPAMHRCSDPMVQWFSCRVSLLLVLLIIVLFTRQPHWK